MIVPALYKPYILIIPNEGLGGVSFDTNEQKLAFAEIAQIPLGDAFWVEGDNVVYDIEGAKNVIYEGTNYVLTTTEKILFKEPAPR